MSSIEEEIKESIRSLAEIGAGEEYIDVMFDEYNRVIAGLAAYVCSKLEELGQQIKKSSVVCTCETQQYSKGMKMNLKGVTFGATPIADIDATVQRVCKEGK